MKSEQLTVEVHKWILCRGRYKLEAAFYNRPRAKMFAREYSAKYGGRVKVIDRCGRFDQVEILAIFEDGNKVPSYIAF